MTTKNRKRSLSAFVALIGVLLMSSGFAIIATAGSASANGQGRLVCHPVAATGGGNTNDGWSIIPPNAASAHIDEETGIGFHEHDGRRDVFADDGKCPPVNPPDECPDGDFNGEEPGCGTPPVECPDGDFNGEEPGCGTPPVECPDGDFNGEEQGCGTPPVDTCPDGSPVVEGVPCEEEVSPPGEEPPAAAPPVNNPPAKSPTPTKRAPATVAAPTTSTPSSTVAGPTIPSTVKAGLGEDVAELAATRTSQGLALVGAGALVMLAGGLGMVRRRGVLARI